MCKFCDRDFYIHWNILMNKDLTPDLSDFKKSQILRDCSDLYKGKVIKCPNCGKKLE